MEKIKFAIIGCGRIAQRHAEHINNYGTLIAVCDIEFAKAKILGEKYNVKAYQNIDDLLNEEKSFSPIISEDSPLSFSVFISEKYVYANLS